jgi:hypothetical protein
MPAYNFLERFVPLIQKGSKKQTIRKRRKHATKPGQLLHLFTGQRTKHSRKILQPICKNVQTIYISRSFRIRIYAARLTDLDVLLLQHGKLVGCEYSTVTGTDLDDFAFYDGFRTEASAEGKTAGCGQLMQRFWKRYHTLPFIGDIIYW